jgi:hypothetical protein
LVLLLAILANCPAVFAAADQSGNDQPSDQAATYSTGKSGSRLKWIAQEPPPAKAEAAKPADRKIDPDVKPAQFMSPPASRRPVRPARNQGLDSSSSPADDGPDCAASDRRTRIAQRPSAERSYVAPARPLPFDLNRPNGGAQRQDKALEGTIAPQRHELKGSCPSPKDLKKIADIGTNITPPEGDLPRDCPLGDDVFQQRSFAPITYTWTASALCHKPLYFEDVQLERYGHMCGPWLQPFASGVNFFLTIPILPYKMGLELPNECMYTLGYYRPGDCAPYLFDPLPLSVRGAFFEAGMWAGGIYAFP